MLLYPRLPLSSAQGIISKVESMTVLAAASQSSTQHPRATYAPTGGNRVPVPRLAKLRADVLAISKARGYPTAKSRSIAHSGFDSDTAALLHSSMDLRPAEASHTEVWAFLGCVLLPDVVRWRFGGVATTEERFTGGSRGIRNVFGRLWWRAEILRDPDAKDPYELLQELGEDELVQITERPNIAGSPGLARLICRTFLDVLDRYPEISRAELLRDAMKRFRRALPLTPFDALTPEELKTLVEDLFTQARTSLLTSALSRTGAARV